MCPTLNDLDYGVDLKMEEYEDTENLDVYGCGDYYEVEVSQELRDKEIHGTYRRSDIWNGVPYFVMIKNGIPRSQYIYRFDGDWYMSDDITTISTIRARASEKIICPGKGQWEIYNDATSTYR
eukprot:UN04118